MNNNSNTPRSFPRRSPSTTQILDALIGGVWTRCEVRVKSSTTGWDWNRQASRATIREAFGYCEMKFLSPTKELFAEPVGIAFDAIR